MAGQRTGALGVTGFFVMALLWAAIGAAVLVATMAPLHARQDREPDPENAEGQQLLVSVRGNRLSIQTGAVPLATVLNAIENATDLRVTIKGDLGNARPQAFHGLALEEGLRRLIGDRHPVVMVYDPTLDRSGTRRLQEVRIYGGNAPEQQDKEEKSMARAPSHRSPTLPVEPDTPVARYLYGSDSAAREEAAKQLEEDPDEVVQVLTAALDHPEGEVRLRALRGLRALEGEEALEYLSQAARRDPDPELRQATIYLLGGFAAGDVRRVLQAALADPDQRVRQAAAQTLSQLRAR